MTADVPAVKPMNRRIVDCHAHLIDPAAYPLPADGIGYRPSAEETGTLQQFCETLDENGVGFAVLVQLSGYGTDNSILVDAMRARPGRFKAIAVLRPDIEEDELGRLAEAGVVGVRFNLLSYDAEHLFRPATPRLLALMRELGWFAQVFAADDQWPRAAAALRAAGVQVLVDHFGLRAPAAIDAPGFAAVLALAQDGLATVKLSAPFRISRSLPGYDDLRPVVDRLLREAGPERLIWGSDWPFPDVRPRPSYGDALAPASWWLASESEREAVLWRTPARLFGFAAEPA